MLICRGDRGSPHKIRSHAITLHSLRILIFLHHWIRHAMRHIWYKISMTIGQHLIYLQIFENFRKMDPIKNFWVTPNTVNNIIRVTPVRRSPTLCSFFKNISAYPILRKF